MEQPEKEFWEIAVTEEQISIFLKHIGMEPFVLADVDAALNWGQELLFAVVEAIQERGEIAFQCIHVPYLVSGPVPGPQHLGWTYQKK